VPDPGTWREIFNSDASEYGGSGMGNGGAATTTNISYQGHYHSLLVTLPPLGVVVFESPGPAA
jgi:1,4-alpha-glucan branching enzyme